jgi:hydrogenase small subunit
MLMLTRREFIKLVMSATAGISLSGLLLPEVAKAVELMEKRPVVIWLEAMTCTGDFLSCANSLHPDLRELLLKVIDLRYSNTLMVAEGEMAIEELFKTADANKGEYILIAEGTIPTRDDGKWGAIGYNAKGEMITDLYAARYFGERAKHIIAVGTCAAFGGPYAANPNPSRSKPWQEVIKGRRIINVPGCPVHPDWFIGTLSHVLLYGIPDLDDYNRPRLFFGGNIHDNCPRRYQFENGKFALHPGDLGCTFKIGCKGPVTFSDCPTRRWSALHNNWPVGANTPCIGCVNPGFPDRSSPFFEHLPDVKVPGITTTFQKFVIYGGAATAAAIGGHALVSLATGRLQQKWVLGTETKEIDQGEGLPVKDTPSPEAELLLEIKQQQEEIRRQVGSIKHRVREPIKLKILGTSKPEIFKKITHEPQPAQYNPDKRTEGLRRIFARLFRRIRS